MRPLPRASFPRREGGLRALGPLLAALAVLLFVGCGARAYPGDTGGPPATPAAGPAVVFPSVSVAVELARTEAEREKGLGGHAPLAERGGMLFIWDQPGPYAFWMKGMTFPIDMIWINDEQVVYLAENAPPPAPGQADNTLSIYTPTRPARYVLEVRAGFARQYGIAVGSRAQIRGA